MSRFHNALSANAFDFSTNVFSEKAFENAFSKAFNASTATFNANSSTFNAHANALSMMNMHTLVC